MRFGPARVGGVAILFALAAGCGGGGGGGKGHGSSQSGGGASSGGGSSGGTSGTTGGGGTTSGGTTSGGTSGGTTSGGTTSGGATTSGGGGPRVAPDGYYVQGDTIFHASGAPHIFRGISRPSLEWNPAGQYLSQADFERIASWKANVVRLPLNQDFWLAGAALHDPGYEAAVDQAVRWARAAGLDVILDLHWSDRGDLSTRSPQQQRMADGNSIVFWREVATKYKGDGRVIFELYNEPHDVSWDVWLSGGPSGDGFQAAGMQQLYDAVRGVGAENLVIAGGLDYGYDLTGVPAHRIRGYNIAYATHPYDLPGKQPADWPARWSFLASSDPVIVTEFGSFDCSTAYTQAVVDYAESIGASWIGWAWWPQGCSFPSLIVDWSGTASAPGQVVKDALGSH